MPAVKTLGEFEITGCYMDPQLRTRTSVLFSFVLYFIYIYKTKKREEGRKRCIREATPHTDQKKNKKKLSKGSNLVQGVPSSGDSLLQTTPS